ncbi:MAG: hypothetical protein AAF717_21285 [Bacteroidota bacterium]|nr:hypothetical protein [uncultured Allomuricauda sp.]
MYSKETSRKLEKKLNGFKVKGGGLPLPFPFPRHAMDYTEGVRFFINECGGFDTVMHIMESLLVIDPNMEHSYEVVIRNPETFPCELTYINLDTGDCSHDEIARSAKLRVRKANLIMDVSVLKLKSEFKRDIS